MHDEFGAYGEWLCRPKEQGGADAPANLSLLCYAGGRWLDFLWQNGHIEDDGASKGALVGDRRGLALLVSFHFHIWISDRSEQPIRGCLFS